MVLASASTRQDGLPRGLQVVTGLLHEHLSRMVALMGRLGGVSYGEVCHFECSLGLLAPVVLTMPRLIGKEVSPREERIRGGLKYTWKNGVSGAPTTSTPLVIP
jgi:hypothetical protein